MMMNSIPRALPTAILAGAIAICAWGYTRADRPSDPVPEDPFAALVSEGTGSPDKSWSDARIESFPKEAENVQSVFISLVQLVELERNNGDVSRAIPTLKDVATRSGKQQLRNATNRLLHDVHVELGNTREAREHLLAIIEESLAQGA